MQQVSLFRMMPQLSRNYISSRYEVMYMNAFLSVTGSISTLVCKSGIFISILSVINFTVLYKIRIKKKYTAMCMAI